MSRVDVLIHGSSTSAQVTPGVVLGQASIATPKAPTFVASSLTLANTGVPAGTVFSGGTFGETTITADNTHLVNCHFTGSLIISANNCTAVNCLIESNENYALLVDDPSRNFKASFCTIDGKGRGAGSPPSGANVGVGYAGFWLYRCQVFGSSDGINANGGTSSQYCTVEESYIHDLWDNGLAEPNNSHNDGLQVTQGSFIKIINSRLDNQLSETSAVMLGADQGSISDIIVDSNLVSGGAYTVYGGQSPNPPFTITRILIQHNRWSTNEFANSGSSGPITATGDANITLLDNLWFDGPHAGTAVS